MVKYFKMKITTISRKKIIYKIRNKTKSQEFCISGIKLLLNKHTLVPHPDTIKLIEISKNILRENSWIKSIADVGTGSGVIAIKLGKIFPQKKFLASDISQEVLKIATENARLNKVKNIRFLLNVTGAWLSEYQRRKIDFIISNPPFVSKKEYFSKKFLFLYPETKLEPKQAVMVPGANGLSPYLQILRNSVKNKTRFYLFQCNSLNIHKLTELINKEFRTYKVEVKKNSSGLDKFLLVENPKIC